MGASQPPPKRYCLYCRQSATFKYLGSDVIAWFSLCLLRFQEQATNCLVELYCRSHSPPT